MRILTVLLGALLMTSGCGEGDSPTMVDPTEVDVLAHGVSHILVPIEKGRPPSTAEPLIRQAARALAAGKDFAVVAQARSDHESSEDGGFLGFVPTNVDTAFAGAVQSLRPGEVSQPVRSSIGWHIIKRHPWDEARALERKYRIPTHGVFIHWDDPKEPNRARTGRTKAEAHKLALATRDRLASGAMSLEDAMLEFTPEEQHALEAFIGFTADRDGIRELFAQLKAAEPGQLLGPIDTPRGWAVVVRGRYLRSLFRHILIQHTASKEREMDVTNTPEQALALAQRILGQVLEDRSRWDALVDAHSDDKWSRIVNGRMGILHPGAMPAGFEHFIYEQKPDTIHPKVVQTEYGFHIVWKVN